MTSASYRIVQRTGTTAGIPVSGTYFGKPSEIEVKWGSGEWTTLAASPSGGSYSGTLASQSQGQATLTMRMKNARSITRVDSYVGIGDVWAIAGQSNAMGYADNNQSYSHATLKAGMFQKDDQWRELADPFDESATVVDSVSDNGTTPKGHWCLPLATSLMAARGVPVGFVPCAKDASSITAWARNESDHDDPTTLYGSMVRRCVLIGGVKGVLWWQGETDAAASMTKATYKAALETLGDNIYEDLGVSLMPCRFLNCSGSANAGQAAIWDAIDDVWGTHHVVAGPDLSDIASDDGAHALLDATVATVAGRWATAMATGFAP